MLFNSLQFAFFLPTVFLLYWLIPSRSIKVQNTLLLIASYFFYASWNWHFLILLVGSTLIDYVIGIQIHQSATQAVGRRWLWLSVWMNLAVLGIFKYYNFFADSFASALQLLGFAVHPASLNLILPIGISFYTFHGLSYVFDLYRKKIVPEKSWVNYSLFVSFFPLLVAGPIERATHLLPQLKEKRSFNYRQVVDGLRQILWGLFKKLVIADNCAAFANPIFDHPQQYPASALILGAVFFAIQIYGDFAGYTDIALGTARLFGIELLRNFSYPYFAVSIPDFWRRWHISLTSWFKDYLYIPLGGNRQGKWKHIQNVFIVFLVSGLWHGANWTFVCWGLLHALYMLPALLRNKTASHAVRATGSNGGKVVGRFFAVAVTFGLTSFAWIFFRATSIQQAFVYVKGIWSASLLRVPHGLNLNKPVLLLIILFFAVEWWGRSYPYALAVLHHQKKYFRWLVYYTLIWAIMSYNGDDQPFIYFQF